MGGKASPGVGVFNVDNSMTVLPSGELRAGGAGTAGRVYETHLEADVLIAAEPPDAPGAFPAGQPQVLLELPGIALRAGPILVNTSASVFITNNQPDVEDEIYVQFQLFIDGVRVGFSTATLAAGAVAVPANLYALETFGGIQRKVTVTAGTHDVQLLWGVQGRVVPAVSAGIYAASNFDHASLVVTEI